MESLRPLYSLLQNSAMKPGRNDADHDTSPRQMEGSDPRAGGHRLLMP
jgi:hypothetical protein